MKKLNIAKWFDGFLLAGKGILMALRECRFWIGFIIAFLFFGTLMNLLSNGLAKFEFMGMVGFVGSLKVIFESFLGIFGVGQYFIDWLLMFFISLLQGILIGLIVLLWHKKRGDNSANVEKVGIITGLVALGAGCPTCGTTLIAPILGAFFSTGGLAVAGTISTLVTIIAIIIAILSLKRLGEETYVIITNERYLKKKEVHEKNH